MDKAVDPHVKTGECDPFRFVNERLLLRKEECIPVNNVCPGSYLVAAELFEYECFCYFFLLSLPLMYCRTGLDLISNEFFQGNLFPVAEMSRMVVPFGATPCITNRINVFKALFLNR